MKKKFINSQIPKDKIQDGEVMPYGNMKKNLNKMIYFFSMSMPLKKDKVMK